MFDHYMRYQMPDPVRQRRLRAAAVISAATTAVLVAFMWVANKMNIARVDAPTISYIMVQMAMDEPPPPPPPPPPPDAPDAEAEDEIPDDEVPLEEELVQPTEIPEKLPETEGKRVPSGVKGGVPGGIPGGVVGGVLGGGMAGGVATKRDTTKDVAKKPIKTVMGQAIYSPDPDKKKLAATKAGRKFPGDPKVDQICRETVKKWRFKPFLVGGKPVRTCSTVEFNIKFN
jgi:protein TonB